MSTPPNEPTEQELREMRDAYEEELKRIAVADVVVQTAVSLINLAGRRLGLSPGAEQERDLEQVRDAIDAVRGLMPVLERRAGRDLGPLRDALSQLQLAYAREAQAQDAAPSGGQAPDAPGADPPGAAEPGTPAGEEEKGEGERRPGPAESTGRLWVPGR